MAGNVGTVAELVGSNEQTILPEWVDDYIRQRVEEQSA